MKNVKLMFLTMAVASLGMSACKKEVVGPTGATGAPGNANVKSLTFETVSGDWVGNSVDGYTATFNTPLITSAIASNGAVMCYLESAGVSYALPYSYFYNSYIRYMSFEYETGVLRVKIIDDDGLTSNLGGTKIKIIAISSTGLAANPDLDLTDYDAVAKAFNFK